MNKNKCIVPNIVESILDKVENRINAAEIKQFSDEELLSLYSVFGVVLQRAFDILEKYPNIVAYKTSKTSRVLIEIKGEKDRCYRVFPKINFCPCPAFKHQVLERKSQVYCKHVLAGRIAQILGKLVYQEVSQDQYLMLLNSMFDLEENNG